MNTLIVSRQSIFIAGIQGIFSTLKNSTTFQSTTTLSGHINNNRSSYDLIVIDLQTSLDQLKKDIDHCKTKNPKTLVVVLFDSCRYSSLTDLVNTNTDGAIPTHYTPAQVLAAINLVLLGEVFAPVAADNYRLHPSNNTDRLRNLVRQTYSEISGRQTDVLLLMSRGYSNKLIADKLYISEGTVKTHLHATFRILKVKSRVEAAQKIYSIKEFTPAT